MRSSSSSLVLSLLLQKYGQKDFLSWLMYPRGVSLYTQGTWDLKSILVLSNAQLFKRVLPVYNRVHEIPFDIPQGYVKGCSIYQQYEEEPHSPRDAVQTNNNNSYVLRRWNTSLPSLELLKILT